MTAYDRLDLLFQQNNGIVKTAQVLEIGIAKSTFYAYAKQRGVEQAAHGVYVSPDAWTDAMYLLHLRCAQAVFSHESALFFHDLTDREPNPYSITVKTGYNHASPPTPLPACKQTASRSTPSRKNCMMWGSSR